jgi:hypothetical protein
VAGVDSRRRPHERRCKFPSLIILLFLFVRLIPTSRLFIRSLYCSIAAILLRDYSCLFRSGCLIKPQIAFQFGRRSFVFFPCKKRQCAGHSDQRRSIMQTVVNRYLLPVDWRKANVCTIPPC